MADQLEALQTALTSVSKDWKQAKRSADKEDRVKRAALEKMRQRRYKPPSIKDAVEENLEEAYLKASAGGTLPANARQIMYAIRPLVMAVTGGQWCTSSYFTQTLLPDFVEEYGRQDWDVVFDARGHFQEPHGGTRVDLGTLAVRHYLALQADDADDLEPSGLIATRFPTAGPDNRYHFALFIEKEGFDPLLKRARIAERFDIAIMSTKGMSVTAARLLVEKLSDRGVTILVAHDFDKAGFSIMETLCTDTRRYHFASEPNVFDIGLRLDDVKAMALPSEPVTYGKNTDPRSNLYVNGATEAEIAYLVRGRKYDGWGDWHGERVELNAMMADQFVTWLEAKLVEAGVEKVVPDDDVLKSAYRRASRLAEVQESIRSTLAAIERVGDLPVPDDLLATVTERITDTSQSWDDAVWDICQERRAELEEAIDAATEDSP